MFYKSLSFYFFPNTINVVEIITSDFCVVFFFNFNCCLYTQISRNFFYSAVLFCTDYVMNLPVMPLKHHKGTPAAETMKLEFHSQGWFLLSPLSGLGLFPFPVSSHALLCVCIHAHNLLFCKDTSCM